MFDTSHSFSIVEHAIELASQWHDGTYRKSTWRPQPFTPPEEERVRTPVITHLTAVAFTVQKSGWDANTIAAAFLHDILEDPNRHGDRMKVATLRNLVGDAITELVLHVTEQKEDQQGNPLPWKVRKEGYLRQLAAASPEAVAISLADKHHNLWTINNSLIKGFDVFKKAPGRKALSTGPEQQQWFFTSFLEVTEPFTDKKMIPVREQLTQEVDRFVKITHATQ